jgi:hypothetical protein
MGMFDYLKCSYPLPGNPPAFVNPGHEFQTKDLECSLDHYEITTDGRLLHEQYDTEDQSDPNAEGFMRLAGMMTRVNKRWVELKDFTGGVEFHDGAPGEPEYHWIEYTALFARGKLLELIETDRVPKETA